MEKKRNNKKSDNSVNNNQQNKKKDDNSQFQWKKAGKTSFAWVLIIITAISLSRIAASWASRATPSSLSLSSVSILSDLAPESWDISESSLFMLKNLLGSLIGG